jgi:hypothetical protein
MTRRRHRTKYAPARVSAGESSPSQKVTHRATAAKQKTHSFFICLSIALTNGDTTLRQETGHYLINRRALWNMARVAIVAYHGPTGFFASLSARARGIYPEPNSGNCENGLATSSCLNLNLAALETAPTGLRHGLLHSRRKARRSHVGTRSLTATGQRPSSPPGEDRSLIPDFHAGPDRYE